MIPHKQKNRYKHALPGRYLCAFFNQACIYPVSSIVINSTAEIKENGASYKDIIKCLRCPILRANISSNPRLVRFFNFLGNQFLYLLKKIELDQMILNKQKFSLKNIQKVTADHRMEKDRQARILQNRINKYESLLAKRDLFLHTLQTLSTIIGQAPDPDTMWKRASLLLTSKLLDLDAVGLLIFNVDCCSIQKCFIDLLPRSLSSLIYKCFGREDFCLRFSEREVFVNLCQIYWESLGSEKRPGPRTEDMLERCLLFPIKENYSIVGVLIALMNNLSSSMEDLAPFFSTAARLIKEGLFAVS